MDPSIDDFDFEQSWPCLHDHLQIVLSRRQIPPWLREDLIQETAVRLWRLRDSIETERSPEALATKIVLNLLNDHFRKEKRLITRADVAQDVAGDDVENEVIARDELALVRSAISRLDPQQKSALATTLHDPPADRAAVPASLRVRKMRARRKLLLIMDELSRAKGRCLLGLRVGWDCVRRNVPVHSDVSHVVPQVIIATLVLAAGTTATPSHFGPRTENGRGQGTLKTVTRATSLLRTSELRERSRRPSRPSDRDVAVASEARRPAKVEPHRQRPAESIDAGPVRYEPDGFGDSGSLRVKRGDGKYVTVFNLKPTERRCERLSPVPCEP